MHPDCGGIWANVLSGKSRNVMIKKWYCGDDGRIYSEVVSTVKRWTAERYDNFRQKQNQARIAWRKRNREKDRSYARVSASNRRAIEGSCSVKDAELIRNKQNDQCIYCHTSLDGSGELDHIIPICQGGSSLPDNLQWLCTACNRRKSYRNDRQFRKILDLTNTPFRV
jgi:5-methylcytosine-specific restriction endonuclease McrA